MKPGYKFFGLTGAAALLSCSLCGILECNANEINKYSSNSEAVSRTLGIFAVISILIQGSYALPPTSLFMKRLGSPMPQLGGPAGSLEDEDSEEEEDLLESAPRVEPQITPMNRDQCLAKLLCGMSVPVTGGSSKKNYYSEYANIVSKFFEAFPLDEEIQSKESIETYDDYSNEDDGKPTRFNSRRKPMNSSRVEATQPTLQLFDLALVDIAKPEDLQNRTKKAAIEKVHRRNSRFSSGHRVARARKIVENLGQKLQTVRQCQSIAGCPFTFKQLREKLKKKEAERISSNVPLPPLPGPIFPSSSKRKEEPTPASFLPYSKPKNRPKPIPPTPKSPESMELFSGEHRPSNPHKDANKGDDELEELFGPPKISNRPLGFHQGVDEHYNYDYNPDKPWRPGSTGENSYSYRPWKNSGPRPSNPYINSGNRFGNEGNHNRPPPRPRPPRPNGPPRPPPSQKRNPPPPPRPQNNNRNNNNSNTNNNNKRPNPPPQKRKPVVQSEAPQRPAPPPLSTTPASPFPKKKISYLSSPYKRPNSNEDDDEGSEDINKVAPVELIGNSEVGEHEPTRKTTTSRPTEETTETPTTKKSKKKNDDDSDEYDDDYEEDDYEEDLDDDDYSDEEADDKKKKKINYLKKKKKKEESEEEEEEEEEEKETTTKAPTTTSTTTTSLKPRRKINTSPHFDDETDDVDAIWMKLNYATTGGQYQDSKKTEEDTKASSQETETQNVSGEEGLDDDEDDDDDDDDDEEEDEEEDKGNSNSSNPPAQKTRTSSVSGSVEDDADDEVDEENQSKPSSKRKSNTKLKKTSTKTSQGDDEVAQDISAAPGRPGVEQGPQKDKNKKSKKKKPTKKGSSEEEEAEAKQKQNIMMEIGGRPLVPKPDDQSANAQKTTSLLSNRFKFQFINPYGAAPPSPNQQPIDGPPPPQAFSHHGPPPPFKSSFGQSSAPSSSSGHGSASSLPFKFKLNAGPLGNLGGGNGIPLGSLPGFGGGSGSVEMPDPHHPPPPTPFMPHGNQLRQEQAHHPQGMSTGGSSGLGSSALSGASSLFKINAISSLKNLFKRPGNGFDPMNPHHDGQGPPPANAFVHRPVGPESSHFNRERASPASGSSKSKKGTKKGSKSGKSKGNKGRKEKV